MKLHGPPGRLGLAGGGVFRGAPPSRKISKGEKEVWNGGGNGVAAIEQGWAHVLVQRSGSAKQDDGANSHGRGPGRGRRSRVESDAGALELYVEAGESRQYIGDPNQHSWVAASDSVDLVHCEIPRHIGKIRRQEKL